MACSQTMARARLMGATSPEGEIDRPFDTDPPEPGAPEGFSFPEYWLIRICPATAGNGRPGSRGSRLAGAGARSAGPAGGNEAQAGDRWRSEPCRVRYGGAAASAATEFLFAIRFAASCGSTNAGGEDFGYFAPWKKRVRIPPLTSRTVEAASRGPLRRGLRFFREEEPALASLRADIACSPACL